MENDQLAQRIRAFRKLKGLTQVQLADKIGLSIAVLGAIERGTRRPEPYHIAKIAEALGIEQEEITNL